MLFALTGGIQIGKTRWLQAVTESLAGEGVRCSGVLAPGIWRAADDPSASDVGQARTPCFEKLGICNVLLPERESIEFAIRRDLADAQLRACTQAERAGLGWAISDEAIARVNRHFAGLRSRRIRPCGCSSLLVVDELGRLELELGEGLSEAMALLKEGPTPAFPHALIVVRRDLAASARRQLKPAWGSFRMIAPDREGESALRRALFAD